VARYHHGPLRSALLETAWAVVGRHGEGGLSLRSVAEALGVSHAAPAHHFPDKESLLDALRAEGWRRFAQALEAEEGDGLKGIGRAYVRFAQEHPQQMRLMTRSGPPRSAEISVEGTRGWQVLERAVAKELGPRRAQDPVELRAMAMAAWAGVHGLAALMTEVGLPEGTAVTGKAGEALRERVLEVIVRGLAAA
jgi:AcrR family transcriptional regulator